MKNTTKFTKNGLCMTNKDLDMRKTGGPFIPAGTIVMVLIRRRDGRLWIDSKQFGKRHLYPKDLIVRPA